MKGVDAACLTPNLTVIAVERFVSIHSLLRRYSAYGNSQIQGYDETLALTRRSIKYARNCETV